MSAAVATRQSQGPSNPTSRINSPLDTKRHFDEPKRNSPQVSNRDLSKNSPKTTAKQPPTRAAAAKAAESTTKTSASTANNNGNSNNNAAAAKSSDSSPQKTRDQSLPPPPPPPPPAVPDEGGDYFSQIPNKYREEPNPFEESFSKPDVLTPGKALLPPASQIASPNTNFGTGSGFNWGLHSLRSGPLSPAMLTGPSAHTYDASLRTGLTPNESGIRSGLTPGGSGSMFPAPSPNTQALFGFGSGPTPGTLEFQKTAMAAQAVNRASKPAISQAIPIPKPDEAPDVMDVSGISAVSSMPQPPQQRHPSDQFAVDANAAANGLYMLAQQGLKVRAESQFVAPANIPQAIPVPTSNVPMNIDPTANNLKRNSIATSGHSRNASTATRGQSEASEDLAGSDGADAGIAKGKKGKAAAAKKGGVVNAGITKPVAGNRRKAEETKAGANKKKKAASPEDEDEDMDDIDDMDEDDHKDGNGQDSKKMTDEEKRKNFLERNRVAALKCRQRKKQWLANLQAKVEYYGAENDALNAQVTNLREEILALKTLLLAHKDCPVSRATGGPSMGGLDALGALSQGDYAQLHHGYPVAQVSMAPPGSRRFS